MDERRKGQLAVRCGARMVNKTRGRGMAAWRANAWEQRQMKDMALRCVRRLVERTMWRSLKRWVDNHVDHRRLVKTCRRIGSRLRQMGQACAFDKWAEEAKEGWEQSRRLSVGVRRHKMHLIGRILDAWICSCALGRYFRSEIEAVNERATLRRQKDGEKLENIWLVQAETERRMIQVRKVLLRRSNGLLNEGLMAMALTSWHRALSRRLIRFLRQQARVQIEQHSEEVQDLQKHVSDIQMRTFRKLSQMQDEYLGHLEHRQHRASTVMQESYDKRLEVLEEAIDQVTAARDDALLQCSYLETALDQAIAVGQDKDSRITQLGDESRDKVDMLVKSLHEAVQGMTEAKETNHSLRKDLKEKEEALSAASIREAQDRERMAALDASLEDARKKEALAQLEIARLMCDLEMEGESLAKQSELLRVTRLKLEACDQRAAQLTAALEDTKGSLEVLQRKEDAAQDRVAELIRVNKQLKSDFEAQRTSSQRELSQARALISKMRDERDAAVQRELQIQMQRHASTSREPSVKAARDDVEPEIKPARAAASSSAIFSRSVKASPVLLIAI